jgi:hypothetical protein
MDCVPAYTTGAIFTSLILMDLFNRNWREIPVRFIFGAFAVLLMTYICQTYGPNLGWVLLGIPAFVLVLGFFYLWSDSGKPKPAHAEERPSCSGCPCCRKKPCRCRNPCSKPALPAC